MLRRTPLTRRTPLKRTTGLKRTKGLNPVSRKTRERNLRWRLICMERAKYLIEKYGFLICEYSGEPIRALTPNAEDLDDAWGHHVDGNRNNCTPGNCYIVKYKYHGKITLENLQVKQEGFEGMKGVKSDL